MSEDTTDQPRRFATRVLPWVVTAVFFAFYLATLNRWVSANSLGIIAQIGGWDGQVPFHQPLLWLITRPLQLVPEPYRPLAANALTALLAAASLGLLARSVAIFPADRTHAQRTRGQLDGLPLDIPFNWIPPVFAVGLLGLQLTFWENATAATGDMLTLFLFAFAVRCLTQYALDERDWRLQQFAFVLGLGCANDWAMVGYLPMFAVAVAWTAGWELLNARRLVTMLVSFAFGLLLYLLMPLVAGGAPGIPGSFGGRFLEVFRHQRVFLLGLPRSRALLLAILMLLPAVFVAIKWRSGGSSGTDQKLKNFFLILLRVLTVAAAVYVAFDTLISPRMLVTTSQQGGQLSLLTFSWVSAFAAGISTGWFILVATVMPGKKWERQSDSAATGARLAAGLCMLGALTIPTALAWLNWPKIRVQNGPILEHLAEGLKRSLPAQPAVVLSEDSALLGILQAILRRDPASPRHLLTSTRSAALQDYRVQLASRHGGDFPALTEFAVAETNVAGLFVRLLQKEAGAGRVFYLHPPVFDPRTSFILETLRTRPEGLIYAVEPYAPREIVPPVLTPAQADRVVAGWNGLAGELAAVTNAASAKMANGQLAALLYSRAANGHGVELQRAGRLVEAGRLFRLAQDLFAQNAVAAVNANVNAALQARKPIPADAGKPLSNLTILGAVEQFGPVDEPNYLARLALALSQATEPLARAAAVAARRALTLAPDSAPAAEAFARAALAAREPELAAEAISTARQIATRSEASATTLAGLEQLQARLQQGRGNLAEAEKTLVDAWKRFPDDAPLIEEICTFYSGVGLATNALPYVDHFLRRHKDDDAILARRGGLLVESGRPGEAVSVLDAVLNRRPDEYEARATRGAALLMLNKPGTARADFEYILKALPNYGRALLGLGRACLAEKNTGDAQRHFQRLLELTPTNSAFHLAAQEQLRAISEGRGTPP